MSKTRVYELAKEFGIENKEFIAKLKTLGIAVKSHSSTLEDSEVERVRREFASKGDKEVVEKFNCSHLKVNIHICVNLILCDGLIHNFP